MNHYAWTYAAGGGRNIPVGLYHSTKKGHLMIYVGKKITAIDFSVLDSKEYTFFIDNELCRIKLERKGEKMFYFFEIDKIADTPMNRARWAMERKFLRQLAIGLVIFAVLVTGFTFFLRAQKQADYSRIDELLEKGAAEAVAKVVIDADGDSFNASYHFIAKNETVVARIKQRDSLFPVLPNGMPLVSGDEFTVEYSPMNPAVNRIDFQRPTKRQIGMYLSRAAEAYVALHPNEAPHIIECMVAVAFELNGVNGIADFYFQDSTPQGNPRHNSLSYLRLVRSLPFQKKIEKDCWK